MKYTLEYLEAKKAKYKAYQKWYYLNVTKNKRIAQRKWLKKAISTEIDNK